MELQKQVISLELAKRLKELGVNQESYFWWYHRKQPNEWHVSNQSTEVSEQYAAFTVAELGEMLPNDVRSERYQTGWCVSRLVDPNFSFDEKNEAEARGLMLAYLIENKLITL